MSKIKRAALKLGCISDTKKIAVLCGIFFFLSLQVSQGKLFYDEIRESESMDRSYQESWENPSVMQEEGTEQSEPGETAVYADSFTKPPVQRGFMENLAIRISNFFKDIRRAVSNVVSRVRAFIGISGEEEADEDNYWEGSADNFSRTETLVPRGPV
ncbi:MAG: hypothetical protein ACQESB_01930, partial [Elusimicrobiota bacterium]